MALLDVELGFSGAKLLMADGHRGRLLLARLVLSTEQPPAAVRIGLRAR